MDGFASWVYARRALPAIEREVNGLLTSISATSDRRRPLVLRGSCGGIASASSSSSADPVASAAASSTTEGISWTLNGMPLTKCSGMQRFAVSMAMRLALSRLGACNVTCAQLIIDEGFGALDSRSIAAVPEFLHGAVLESGRFASVLLVSHLDGVREAADLVVPIRTSSIREDAVLSCLRFVGHHGGSPLESTGYLS